MDLFTFFSCFKIGLQDITCISVDYFIKIKRLRWFHKDQNICLWKYCFMFKKTQCKPLGSAVTIV